MAVKIIKDEKLQWINIDSNDAEGIEYLRKNFNFHDLDIEDIRGESHTPKIDTYKNYLFLVIQIPSWSNLSQTVISQEVNIFLSENFVITIEHNKTKEMKYIFYRCLKNRSVRKDWMSKDSGYLFYRIIESLFHDSQPILNNLGRQLSLIEDQIFNKEPNVDVIRELASYRRNILLFRRILDPQRYLVSNLSHIRKGFLTEENSLYFDDISDYLTKLWSIVEAYKETVQGLHVTVESLINQRTNKVIGALTVISVALLPLNLLSGIYGMNITALPYAQHPYLVWVMFLSLATLILLIIAIMRKKKYI